MVELDLPRAARHASVVDVVGTARWLVRSRRNRVAAELGRHPLGRRDRTVATAVLVWLASCSVAAGVLLSALGPEARVRAGIVVAALVVLILVAAVGTSRTTIADLGTSAFRQRGLVPLPVATLVAADALSRGLVAFLLVSLSLVPALGIVLTVQWGVAVAAAGLTGLAMAVGALALLALVGSLVRAVAGARLVLVTGHAGDLLVRALGSALLAGVGAYVVAGMVSRAVAGGGWAIADPTSFHVTAGQATPFMLVAATVLAAVGGLVARVTRSGRLHHELRALVDRHEGSERLVRAEASRGRVAARRRGRGRGRGLWWIVRKESS